LILDPGLFVLLGSGGWIPTDERETCCALVRSGSQALVFDAGTGLRRLAEERELLGGIDRLDIVLTHFHLDHVVGLGYLPALPLRATIWGAGPRLAGRGTAEILGGLVGAPFFGAELASLADVRELDPDEPLELGAFRVETRVQERHAHPTLGLRVGGLVYCTDTGADPETAAFAAGCELLCHDAWTPDAGDDNHASAAEAAAIARDAGAERLLLIHVNPLAPTDPLLSTARQTFAATELGADVLRSELRAPHRR
jgi:ribonuclease BN (tRNA processing enzyme)